LADFFALPGPFELFLVPFLPRLRAPPAFAVAISFAPFDVV
jgi:hypothetical protein